MVHPADTSPNEDPASVELAARINLIETYIDQRTAETEPLNDIEGWVAYEVVKMFNDGGFASLRKTYDPAEGSTEYEISHTPANSMEYYTFTSTDRKDSDFGKYLIYVDSEEEGTKEVMADSVEEAVGQQDFVGYLGKLYDLVSSGKMEEKKREYVRHNLPSTVESVPLEEGELGRFKQAVRVDEAVDRIGNIMAPVARMRADTGESWLASGIYETERRKYIAMYRPQEDPAQPYQAYIVYTSLSQATWRLLPKLGKPGNPHWHYKTASEELVTLPAQLQGVLWQYVEKAPLIGDLEKGEFFDAVTELGAKKFDTFLAGMEAKVEALSQFKIDEAKLPVASTNEEGVISSFSSPLYGDIDMRLVPSRDGTLDYYTYTRRSDGFRWVGMIQVHDAKMLDSFLLDKVVDAPGFYASPKEYGREKGSGYKDNTDRVLGNIAVRALEGLL